VYVLALELVVEEPDNRRVTATAAWNTKTHLCAAQGRAAEVVRPHYEWSRFGFIRPEAAVIAHRDLVIDVIQELRGRDAFRHVLGHDVPTFIDGLSFDDEIRRDVNRAATQSCSMRS
jgi:hypothetical protein